MASDTRAYTYQTRPTVCAASDVVLSEYAGIYARASHTLLKRLCAGAKVQELKSPMMEEFGVTARQFNAVRVEVEGKFAAGKQQLKGRIDSLGQRIKDLEGKLPDLEKRARWHDDAKRRLHQQKRKRTLLGHQLDDLTRRYKEDRIPICFGGKKRFRAQYALKENGYRDRAEWLADYRKHRSNQFYCLGSKDESGGNQTCTATLQEDGSLILRLRLPEALAKTHGKYLVFSNVRFAYGHEEVCRALQSCTERARRLAEGDPTAKSYGTPIHYRFYQDEKGWIIFATVNKAKVPAVTKKALGVIGVDLNVNHVAVTELDRFGNPISAHSIPLVTYGKSTRQIEAAVGDVCAQLVTFAREKGKPLVHEELDFTQKKLFLRESHTCKQARMLSSFGYRQFAETLTSRAWQEGVDLHAVNPAYTSIIGRVKFARRYGLSIHLAAACVIGRRYLGFSERAPRHPGPVPDGKGNHVAISAPVRKRGVHVWKHWAAYTKKLKTALATRSRTASGRSSHPPP